MSAEFLKYKRRNNAGRLKIAAIMKTVNDGAGDQAAASPRKEVRAQ